MHRLTQVWQGAPARSGQGTTLSDRWSSTKGVASSFAASVQGHTCLFLSRCLWHSFFFSSRLLLIYLFPPQKLLDFATIKSVFGANKYNGIELQKKKNSPGNLGTVTCFEGESMSILTSEFLTGFIVFATLFFCFRFITYWHTSLRQALLLLHQICFPFSLLDLVVRNSRTVTHVSVAPSESRVPHG